MTVTQAQLIAPGIEIAEANPEADAAALLALANWAARQISPLAAPDPPNGIWIEATGLAHLHGGEIAMLGRLERALGARGFATRTAIADAPGAAWAWARFGAGGVVEPRAQEEVLGPLPLAALRISAEIVDAFARLGVETVADLAALPRGPTTRRYGKEPLLLLDRGLGRMPEPISPVPPPRLLAAHLAFLEPLITPGPLAEAVRYLLADLAVRLALGGLGVRGLRLIFTRVDGSVQRVVAGTARPTRDPEHLACLLLPRLEAVDPGFGIEAARLVALRVERLTPKQLGGEDAIADGLAELLDRLVNRPEAGRVACPAAVESDIPERSVEWWSPFKAPGPGWSSSLPRPPRLLSPPEPVEVIALLPDGLPVCFRWRGALHNILRADGPERLFGEWWVNPAEDMAVRDYFAVEDKSGARFWLFRAGDGEDTRTGNMRWWCHGVFG